MIATGPPPVTVKGSQDRGADGHAWRGRERDDVARDEREDRDILLCHPPTRCPWQARINDTVRIIVSGGID